MEPSMTSVFFASSSVLTDVWSFNREMVLTASPQPPSQMNLAGS